MLLTRWFNGRVAIIISALCRMIAAQTDGFNPFIFPEEDQEYTAGQDFLIAWEPTPKYDDKVSIRLLSGETDITMELGPTIAAKISAKVGKFKWTIPEDLGREKTYGLRLSLDEDPLIFQYSYPFKIKFLKPLPSSSVAKSSTTINLKSTTTDNPQTTIAENPKTTTTQETTKGIDKAVEAGSSSNDAPTASLEKIQQTPNLVVSQTTATVTSTNSAVAAASSAPSTGKTGMSSGTKTGIGVGVALGVAGLFILLLWFVVKRLRRPSQSIADVRRYSTDGEGKLISKGPDDCVIEMTPGPRVLTEEEKMRRLNAVEMDGGFVARKLELEGDAGTTRTELEGDRKRRDVYELG